MPPVRYRAFFMENELKIGEYNHLRIIKEVPFGLYLDGYEDEILLPLQYVPATYEIDSSIDVFIYRDSEDRIIATTLKPYATIKQFAYLEVKSVTPLGVFLEWKGVHVVPLYLSFQIVYLVRDPQQSICHPFGLVCHEDLVV